MRVPVSTCLRSRPTPKFGVPESTWPGDRQAFVKEDTPIRCCVLYATDGIGTGSAVVRRARLKVLQQSPRDQASLYTCEV
ncbi:hypothetical protein DAEQUDRAFT_724313 [Daedalea quercina L-15889]|uniref:Uncharacterized protein n=1 Tax=Daedalea quercina L-15889 TaxID=1314783 RepID=A0A165RZT2_9APHY|nr:hypothetical protein DAEQUDRAFT_724313 [Daedalea quercina L-15889]